MREKGITLIALIITIIVILILAGVGIAFLTGDNGILTKAISAKSESQKSSAIEKLNLKLQSLITNKNGIAKLLDLNEFVDNTSSNYDSEIELINQVQATDTEAKIKMDGYVFTINNLLKISSIDGKLNQLPINTASTIQGTEVVLPDSWGTTATRNISTSNGLEVSSVKISSVYAVAVGDGVTVPVPYGFYYVGGNLNTGVIISDNENDAYSKLNIDRSGYTYVLSSTTNHLVGNQFVFIPCLEADYKKKDWGVQTAGWDNTTSAAEYTQIEKYGGFYVGRYEAGLATTISEFTTAQYAASNQIYNKSGIPQSKSELVPWDFIDWINSKANSESMYKTEYVSSGLITGTQWDVILNTLINKASLTTGDMTNSVSWGNYSNDSLSFGGAFAIYNSSYLYPFGNTSVTGSNLYKTGESQSAMKYGISDIAGNLFEWTEEDSHQATSGQYRIIRSGGYANPSNNYPAAFRLSVVNTVTYTDTGFRVVLYMK